MTQWMTATVLASLVLLLGLSAKWAAHDGNWRRFGVEAAGLLAFALFLFVLFGFPLPADVVAKGSRSDLALALALYTCMLAGMFAQHLYDRSERPKSRRKKFDWGVFMAPVFASPIVFLPLLAALQNADVDLTELTIPRLMVFLVAFQNGFFWKEHFDNKRRRIQETGNG